MKKDNENVIREEIVQVINPLRNNWKTKTEKELEILLKKLGETCRDETSLFRKEILSDNYFAQQLIEIGYRYDNNFIILREIISSIDNMHARYHLEITDNIFQFLIIHTKNKKLNFYISLFITNAPQFENYPNKWEYILSIPNISPKKKSISTFYRVIKERINIIPQELMFKIISIFEKKMEEPNLHEVTVKKYSEIIYELKNL